MRQGLLGSEASEKYEERIAEIYSLANEYVDRCSPVLHV